MASRSLNILIAPNSFKESMSAVQAAQAIALGLQQASPKAKLLLAPLADGGSGFVEAIIGVTGGQQLHSQVLGPRGKNVKARYGILPDGETAVIEMAAASGLALLSPAERNPMLTSSYGTGQLIERALRRGVKRIVIGVGDSATIDGGVGALQALGLRLIDVQGRTLGEGSGSLLARIRKIDPSSLDKRLAKTEIIIATDVDNLLLGEKGAARVFGPQKGASASLIHLLDEGLTQWADVLTRHSGKPVAELPGSGAGGGFAVGFASLLGAKIVSGSSFVFDLCNIKEKIDASDLIFTGEGALDEQTLQGKTPARLAEAARKANKPLIAFAARIDLKSDQLKKRGFYTAVSIIDQLVDLAEARTNGPQLLETTAARTLSLIMLGTDLAQKR